MSGAQLAQYKVAIEDPRQISKPRAVLEILQLMRAISLHPGGSPLMSDSDFIGASARMRIAFDALDAIAQRRERALIFLDDLDLHGRQTSSELRETTDAAGQQRYVA